VASGNRRFYRSLLLVLAAMGGLVWTAMDQFGISRREISELLLGAVLAVAVVIGAAAVVVCLWVFARRLLSRNRD
jgi:drug/metabolite transporter (DMT)-like permease